MAKRSETFVSYQTDQLRKSSKQNICFELHRTGSTTFSHGNFNAVTMTAQIIATIFIRHSFFCLQIEILFWFMN